jgi:hypothetical protein
MLKMTMVVMPDALTPLICAVVKPLALPMLPFLKIIAVAAVARCELATDRSRLKARLASPDIFRGAVVGGLKLNILAGQGSLTMCAV